MGDSFTNQSTVFKNNSFCLGPDGLLSFLKLLDQHLSPPPFLQKGCVCHTFIAQSDSLVTV